MTRNEIMLVGAARAIVERRRTAHRLPHLALTREIVAELGGNLSVEQVEQTAAALASINPETIIFGRTLNDTYWRLAGHRFRCPQSAKSRQ